MTKASDNDFPSLLVTEQVAKPTAPAAGKRRVYMKTDHKLYSEDDGGTEAEIGGAGGSLTSENDTLGGDVTLTNNDTWYNGASLSLAAGTWLVIGVANVRGGSSAYGYVAKLWDGASALYASSEVVGVYSQHLVVVAIITLVGTTTVYLSVATNAGAGGIIDANTQDVATGNVATQINAVKIA